MLRLNIEIDKRRLTRLRRFSRNYPGKVPEMLRKRVRPVVLRLVKKTLAEYPGASKHPFVFATTRSRNYYFVNVRLENIRTIGRGSGRHYARTEKMRKAWDVVIDARANESLIGITNNASYNVAGQIKNPAGFVYGGGSFKQVTGFKNTGWGRNFKQDLQQIRTATRAEIGAGLKQIEQEESDAE